jgi:hypothetical protein
LWSSFLLFSTSNAFPSWLTFIPITCVSHIMSPHSWNPWFLAYMCPLTLMQTFIHTRITFDTRVDCHLHCQDLRLLP